MIGGLKHVFPPFTMMIQEILLLSFVAPRQQRFVVLVDFSMAIHQIRWRRKTPEAARIVFVCCNGCKATGAAVDILKNYPSSPSIQLMTWRSCCLFRFMPQWIGMCFVPNFCNRLSWHFVLRVQSVPMGKATVAGFPFSARPVGSKSVPTRIAELKWVWINTY